MIPLILSNWRLVGFTLVLAFAGVQSYRLQSAQGQIALYKLEEKNRQEVAAREALHQLRNKERTDAQLRNDLRAAHAAGVRLGVKQGEFVHPRAAGSADSEVACYDLRELNTELGGWAERVVERFRAVAQQAEEVAAAYRACRDYALDLSEFPEPQDHLSP